MRRPVVRAVVGGLVVLAASAAGNPPVEERAGGGVELAALPVLSDGGLPPPGLACLPRWYAGQVVVHDGAWGLELPGGEVVPWDSPGDGGVGLSRLYDVPYVPGPIVPVDTSDAGAIEDPGRVRVEQLLKATYGSTRRQVASRMQGVRFFGTRYAFHERAAPALRAVVKRLVPQVKKNRRLRPFLTRIGGTFSWRQIAHSRNLSTHAFGVAIDLNVTRAHYWRWTRKGEAPTWKNRFPQAIIDAFEAEGFIWGGRWIHFDTMHFEYRPELLSPACRDGPVESTTEASFRRAAP